MLSCECQLLVLKTSIDDETISTDFLLDATVRKDSMARDFRSSADSNHDTCNATIQTQTRTQTIDFNEPSNNGRSVGLQDVEAANLSLIIWSQSHF